jgi:hypothetical protein
MTTRKQVGDFSCLSISCGDCLNLECLSFASIIDWLWSKLSKLSQYGRVAQPSQSFAANCIFLDRIGPYLTFKNVQ